MRWKKTTEGFDLVTVHKGCTGRIIRSTSKHGVIWCYQATTRTTEMSNWGWSLFDAKHTCEKFIRGEE